MKRIGVKELRKMLREGWRIERLPGEFSWWERGRRVPDGAIEMTRYAPWPQRGVQWKQALVTPHAMRLAQAIVTRIREAWARDEPMGVEFWNEIDEILRRKWK